jgi:hypothetical protein
LLQRAFRSSQSGHPAAEDDGVECVVGHEVFAGRSTTRARSPTIDQRWASRCEGLVRVIALILAAERPGLGEIGTPLAGSVH